MMALRTFPRPRLGENVVCGTTPSGIRVAVARKPGFSTAAGFFGLRFGSNDTRFRGGGGEVIQVPDGAAHFLEHKLFEGRKEKVFDRFGRIGARFNGGTSFQTTVYYFLSAGRFPEGLEILLDFVQHPLITEARVEKEKGIIEQEVRMYEDDPGFRGIFLLHRALFSLHPVRIPPGGTVESVRATTAADLQNCFDAFYRPQNLVLSLAGDLDPQEVMARVEALSDPPRDGSAQRLQDPEPEGIASPWLEETFPVSRPHAWIGWREKRGVGLGPVLQRRRLLSSLALDLAFDLSSSFHEDLYLRGILDDTFSSFYRSEADYGYAGVHGLTSDPVMFAGEIRSALERFVEEGPSSDDFERLRRAAWGGMVSGLETPDSLAGSVLHSLLDDLEPLSVLEVLEDITFEEVRSRARELFREDNSSVAVLRPPGRG